MGGGYYDRVMESAPSSSSADSSSSSSSSSCSSIGSSDGVHTATADAALSQSKALHPKCAPTRNIVCPSENAIMVAIDVTGSMGHWTKIIYDKMPMFYGQLMIQGYVKDPSLSFGAVGDLTCDKAPLQITDFANGKTIDEWLGRLWLEGGGGDAPESYEAAAYYYSKHASFPSHRQDVKPILFITGDASYRDELTRLCAWTHMSDILMLALSPKEIFASAQKTLDIFFLFKTDEATAGTCRSNGHNNPVLAAWQAVLPSSNICPMTDPKSVVDIMLGVIALKYGVRTFDEYVNDLRSRDQTDERIRQVTVALTGLIAESTQKVAANEPGLGDQVWSFLSSPFTSLFKNKSGAAAASSAADDEVKESIAEVSVALPPCGAAAKEARSSSITALGGGSVIKNAAGAAGAVMGGEQPEQQESSAPAAEGEMLPPGQQQESCAPAAEGLLPPGQLGNDKNEGVVATPGGPVDVVGGHYRAVDPAM